MTLSEFKTKSVPIQTNGIKLAELSRYTNLTNTLCEWTALVVAQNGTGNSCDNTHPSSRGLKVYIKTSIYHHHRNASREAAGIYSEPTVTTKPTETSDDMLPMNHEMDTPPIAQPPVNEQPVPLSSNESTIHSPSSPKQKKQKVPLALRRLASHNRDGATGY